MERLTNEILEVGLRAGRRAAQICRQVLAEAPAEPDAMAKLGKEPVTVADYGSQAVILEAVRRHFPSHAVIAEEGAQHLRENAGDASSEQIVRLVGEALERPVDFEEVCDWIDHEGGTSSELTWAIDPIDGTKGFLRRDQFAVAIGVLVGGEPFAGVLVCPNLPVDDEHPEAGHGVAFLAARGRGTLRQPLAGGEARRVRVSDVHGPEQARVLGSVESAHGDPKMLVAVREDLGLGGGIVRVDSQVKYGVVASGGAEIYLRPQSRPDYREKIWDHAAGVIVTQEAGGRVTDLRGRELDFSLGRRLEQNRGVLATNSWLHDEVLESLGRLGAGG